MYIFIHSFIHSQVTFTSHNDNNIRYKGCILQILCETQGLALLHKFLRIGHLKKCFMLKHSLYVPVAHLICCVDHNYFVN